MDSLGEAPGANDDASGTAAVMELACVMARRQFEAPLVFMAVPGEEQGLLGAAQWAREARAAGTNVEAMITNDIIGSSRGDAGQHDPKRLRLFADGLDPLVRLLMAANANRPATEADAKALAAMQAELLPLLQAGGSEDLPTHQLGRHLKAAAEAAMPGFTVQLIQRRDRYLRGGDHLPFLERGYAAVRITEPFENFAHQHQNPRTENGVVYGDLPEFVDFAYVGDVTRANLAGLATLAWAPAPLKGVRLDARELTNDSTLEWQPSDQSEAAQTAAAQLANHVGLLQGQLAEVRSAAAELERQLGSSREECVALRGQLAVAAEEAQGVAAGEQRADDVAGDHQAEAGALQAQLQAGQRGAGCGADDRVEGQPLAHVGRFQRQLHPQRCAVAQRQVQRQAAAVQRDAGVVAAGLHAHQLQRLGLGGQGGQAQGQCSAPAARNARAMHRAPLHAGTSVRL